MALLVFVLGARSVFAHNHTSFKINEKVYSFVIGSLNEPVALDHKIGRDNPERLDMSRG